MIQYIIAYFLEFLKYILIQDCIFLQIRNDNGRFWGHKGNYFLKTLDKKPLLWYTYQVLKSRLNFKVKSVYGLAQA